MFPNCVAVMQFTLLFCTVTCFIVKSYVQKRLYTDFEGLPFFFFYCANEGRGNLKMLLFKKAEFRDVVLKCPVN